MGSTFKTFTTANALEIGTVNLKSGYDASEPIRVARFIIRDDHAKNRWLSVPEILVYSSNIGAAKMALDIGSERQRKFLGDLGLLRAAEIELPEVGSPLSPTPWREINTMTIAFGHGVAVSPVQLANAFATIINGGVHHVPTLFKRVPGARTPGKRVLSEHVSADMRHLLRRIVVEGTGKKAAAPGYVVGGKTGTAEKAKAGGYNRKALIASFVGAFPMNDPRYVVLALLDEPKGNESTFNFASAGWTAAPTVGRIISRIAPILAVKPIDEDDRQLMAAAWTP
jgi:cell division protein FtsI (penicillin-binding protein 3)